MEVGGLLLRALAHVGRPMPLKDLAREAGMSPPKAHPYLVSFCKLGLIEQDATSGHYGLGPLALQLGLISLQQHDPVRVATPLMTQLCRDTGHTVAIALWGTHGPTIVRTEEAITPVHVNMRHGTVMSIVDTASGQLLAAYKPPEQVKALFDGELARERANPWRDAPMALGSTVKLPPLPEWEAFQQQLARVRTQGVSIAIDRLVPGICAMSVPVFDYSGSVVLALTVIGPSGIFDTRADGVLAQVLKACARQISQRLGALAARCA
ncbi:IclR family transcriptional regulator [Caldimonas tepidiphila]|uniref:IclR family transcriptional regulator n=1 Tax=Caldimonas tepidiphila TaxID=2315841 RepID=UPI001F0BDD64|nr:IclR family transcriptional regulator [Caldimonas tepidiphila]